MSSDDPVRIPYTISIGLVGAVRRGVMEVDRDEWNGLTPAEREKYIDEMYEVELSNTLDGGWHVENADLSDPVVEA